MKTCVTKCSCRSQKTYFSGDDFTTVFAQVHELNTLRNGVAHRGLLTGRAGALGAVSLGLVRRAGSTQRREKRSRPFDGGWVMPESS